MKLNERNISSSTPHGEHLPGGSRELQQNETTAKIYGNRYKGADTKDW